MSVKNSASHNHYLDDTCTNLSDSGETETGWHVIWTRSNFEKIVRDQLCSRGYEIFLPMVREWSARQQSAARGSAVVSSAPGQLTIPMFKGYLFVRKQMDKSAYLDISNTRGVVHLLGVRWNRLARIPDQEIASIKIMEDSHLPLLPYPYLKAGSKVLITRGPLANARGTLVRSDCAKGLFVVSVPLLQSSVAVSVVCADLAPV